MTAALVRFDHLDRMTDDRGLFEHADGIDPRVEHGYCVDDNARLLVVTSREPDAGAPERLSRVALELLRGAQAPDGRTRNRMDVQGRWTDEPSTDDCWGRSVMAFGVAATHHGNQAVRASALDGFDRAVDQRSAWSRSMAFAALGAADVLALHPEHPAARSLLLDAATSIGTPRGRGWQWPEPRLRYANATLAEALIAAGAGLHDRSIVDRGLTMLAWLFRLESERGHLSLTPVGGRSPDDDDRARFDQQPIEAAAMADACWRAHSVTNDATWTRGIAAAAGWFTGDNDGHVSMRDDSSGGCFDGLTPSGVNTNQGAESALALTSTMQRARSFVGAA